ncbi:MAG: excinuclease ABC subunit UvrB [Armatimonadetes bacterium]|nr:excinuclease ABC subunit UvrB [Armatimonadota bacterium]
MKEIFQLQAPFPPGGDQVPAIKKLVEGLKQGCNFQTLLGVTGSGKTFTMANCISQLEKPALIISHNKTLAAQLCAELREFFPLNAVEYFVSYYDYYQPEAYIPSRDIYIEKDSSINEEIDRLRHRATSAILSRKDVIIVASVSCIYGLGSPEDYKETLLILKKNQIIKQSEILKLLTEMYYSRNNLILKRGEFRVLGEILEIYPAGEEKIIKIEFFGDFIEKIKILNPVSGEVNLIEEIIIYPAKHFITPLPKLHKAIESIKEELAKQLEVFKKEGKRLEYERLKKRTEYDLELLKEVGYCNGIENYSRHLSGRKPGDAPATLLDYFPGDFLTIIDESHVSLPQIRGMHSGDRSRKKNLIEHGFRLPSAYDNRPLTFSEFMHKIYRVIFVSATPGDYEIKNSKQIAEQIVRPTGLVDPKIIIRPVEGQVKDLIKEAEERIKKNERVLVNTLTKKMAEDLAQHLALQGIKVRYLHSEIGTLERIEILRNLRLGKFDILVGVNLLREGLDLPEVSLVAILDADKEGFLRSETSLIQTMGRAARNVSSAVILYADKMTLSIQNAVNETNRRDILETKAVKFTNLKDKKDLSLKALKKLAFDLEASMKTSAKNLEFEKAAALRDEMYKVREEIQKKEKEENFLPRINLY